MHVFDDSWFHLYLVLNILLVPIVFFLNTKYLSDLDSGDRVLYLSNRCSTPDITVDPKVITI